MNVSRFSFQTAYTVLTAYGIESAVDNQTALMAGLMNATFSACNFVFNPVIGYLADHFGYRPVIVLIAVFPLSGLGAWLILSRLHAKAQQQEVPASAANP
jgi:MFS family permease